MKATDIYQTIDKSVWKQKWVVHSKSIGRGEYALKYLAQYIFRPAISNKHILNLESGKVTFKYQESSNMTWKTMTLNVLEFIRRYLQHVLPKGFVKIRYYGLYSHRHLETRKQLRKQVGEPDSQEQENTKRDKSSQSLTCPYCGRVLLLLGEIRRGGLWPKAPPLFSGQYGSNEKEKIYQ